MRPFRFLAGATEIVDGRVLAERARRAESIGYDALSRSWRHIFIGSITGLTEKLVGLRERLGIRNVMLGELGELDPVVERLAGT